MKTNEFSSDFSQLKPAAIFMPLKGPGAGESEEIKNFKEEMRLRESETARLRNKNLDMEKRLKSIMSCQICDEPYNNKYAFLSSHGNGF